MAVAITVVFAVAFLGLYQVLFNVVVWRALEVAGMGKLTFKEYMKLAEKFWGENGKPLEFPCSEPSARQQPHSRQVAPTGRHAA